ncbi:isocitrate lyase/PEP mutase family protein [Candidimonas humi]|uniref:Oxaloacetate decarboxylase n=1 Tax=Candidimonas humi TaxID=683355 RepID=A0ABV8NZG6_9BURK|nr:isocitrate lyase/PEP mutase family protein [Candidimonas humi]MBV6306743.1 isocitrate lyase/PEP mutase family protein [Candidimonas humi]
MSANAKRLREMMQGHDMIVAPGAYDGLTARLVEQAGFPAVYMTGAGTSAARGYPDYGLLTMTEMVEAAGILARSVGIPVIADADTGYGNELNVTRTVREYEARGVAGIHIEDQVAPKRCGHLDGKEIIPCEEYVAKIRAAAAARRDPAFVIIARTDARAVSTLEEAVRRANGALAAGADMAFVEAVQSYDELRAVPRLVHGPCLLNIVKGGKTPDIVLDDARAAGYRLAILPSLLSVAAIEGCEQALQALKSTGRPPSSASGASLRDRFRRFQADEWDELRTRFREPGASAPAAGAGRREG